MPELFSVSVDSNKIMNYNSPEGRAYMKRALQLSLMGAPNVSPNPMVGAVIVADGRIIGEGYHRQFGEAHAEVNAIKSVREKDRHLLKKATMYVTLEPCSHFGKTPPCADLLISERIPAVKIATEDPFLKNYESGIEKMRAAGIDVEIGMLGDEARFINRRFFTAHTLKRPYVLLKWARSSDGFIAGPGNRPVSLSSAFTKVLMHRERSLYDAILVGPGTIVSDNPSLTVRYWPEREPSLRPLKVTFDSDLISGESKLEAGSLIRKHRDELLGNFLERLYREYKITSLMVEGGRKTLESFLKEGLYDEIRVETSSVRIGDGVPSPEILNLHPVPLSCEIYGGNMINTYLRNDFNLSL